MNHTRDVRGKQSTPDHSTVSYHQGSSSRLPNTKQSGTASRSRHAHRRHDSYVKEILEAIPEITVEDIEGGVSATVDHKPLSGENRSSTQQVSSDVTPLGLAPVSSMLAWVSPTKWEHHVRVRDSQQLPTEALQKLGECDKQNSGEDDGAASVHRNSHRTRSTAGTKKCLLPVPPYNTPASQRRTITPSSKCSSSSHRTSKYATRKEHDASDDFVDPVRDERRIRKRVVIDDCSSPTAEFNHARRHKQAVIDITVHLSMTSTSGRRALSSPERVRECLHAVLELTNFLTYFAASEDSGSSNLEDRFQDARGLSEFSLLDPPRQRPSRRKTKESSLYHVLQGVDDPRHSREEQHAAHRKISEPDPEFHSVGVQHNEAVNTSFGAHASPRPKQVVDHATTRTTSTRADVPAQSQADSSDHASEQGAREAHPADAHPSEVISSGLDHPTYVFWQPKPVLAGPLPEWAQPGNFHDAEAQGILDAIVSNRVLFGDGFERYRVKGLLGRGAFGQVYCAETRAGELVAIKVVHKAVQYASFGGRAILLRERDIMRRNTELNKPGIVHLQHSWSDRWNVYLAMVRRITFVQRSVHLNIAVEIV